MNPIKRVLLYTILSMLILQITAPAAVAFQGPSNPGDLGTMIDKVVLAQLEELGIPGAIVSVVVNGETVLNKGYGYADLGQNIITDVDKTMFRIGSTSKLFTWTAVMQLVEQGKLDLDADVNTYLDFALPSKLKYYPGKVEPAPITLRHLLTHTPGFEDLKENIFFLDAAQMPILEDFIKNNIPLRVFPPGEVVAYSNYGTALAGYIVERVSGMSFAQYADKNIFVPLGMTRSTFCQPLPEQYSSHMARGSRFIKGEYQEDSFVYISIAPAGSMSTTAGDMAKFMNAHLNGGSLNGQKILNPMTVHMMHSQQFTHHPLLDGMAFGFVENTINGQRVLSHGGDIFAFQSAVYLLPEHNVGLFVSYSGGGYGEPIGLIQEFMDQYYPSTHTSPGYHQDHGAMERAKAFAGEYLPNRRNYSTDESLLSLMEAMQVTVNQNGNLSVTYLGETNEFIETEPGLYRTLREGRSPSPFGAFNALVFERGTNGRTMLFTDGKVSYSKAPWYSTSIFTILTIVIVLLFTLVTLMARITGFGIRVVKKRKLDQTKTAMAARWASTCFGSAFLVLLLGVVGGTTQTHPIFELPLSLFGIHPAWNWLMVIPTVLMVIFGLAMIPFTILIWRNGSWSRFARIHYTLFTALSLALLGVFNHWNLLF